MNQIGDLPVGGAVSLNFNGLVRDSRDSSNSRKGANIFGKKRDSSETGLSTGSKKFLPERFDRKKNNTKPRGRKLNMAEEAQKEVSDVVSNSSVGSVSRKSRKLKKPDWKELGNLGYKEEALSAARKSIDRLMQRSTGTFGATG